MKFYEATSTIAARPEAIWAILTDADGLSRWDSGIERIEGRIAAGEKIKLYSELNPGRGHPIKITQFSPPERMTWKGGMPLGLFTGVRTYTLGPQADGLTKFTMREEFTGPLLPLIWRSMPDMGPSFEKLAAGLKERAEHPG